MVYAWLVERTPPDKRDEFEAQLNSPLPGEEAVATEFDEWDEGESFLSTMSKLGGRG